MENKRALFGPAGSDEEFSASGKKTTADAPGWYADYGLDCYEYQGGRGLRSPDSAYIAVGKAAKAAGIKLSVHAPYFISLSGIETETRLKSIDYIKTSVHAAELMGADTIVIHTGSASKITRSEAMELAADTLIKTLEEVGNTEVRLGLETMGKINQLGTLDEVLTLCKIDPRLCPVVDFGHLNARGLGGVFPDEDSYSKVFSRIADVLGAGYAENLHCHFSRIQYTNSGEKCHLTFDGDTEGWGPDSLPLMNVIAREGLAPRIICESAGTQGRDALTMKKQYLAAAAALKTE